ncbi:MAG: YbdD/YjiX family protein [Gemmatimonadaceae bacterium]
MTSRNRGSFAPIRSVARLADVVRRIIGVPDYQRYVAHLEACHPDQRPMSRDEFTRQRLNERYNKPGSRCC